MVPDKDSRRYALELLGARTLLGELYATYPELKNETSDAVLTHMPRLEAPTKSLRSELVAEAKSFVEGKRRRRSFSDDFRQKALDRVRKGDYVTDVARSLKLRESVLRNWCKEAGVSPGRMPKAERARRTAAGRRQRSAEKPGTLTKSEMIGLATLAHIAENGGKMHYKDLAAHFKLADHAMIWRLRVRRQRGQLALNGSGEWEITDKGRAFLAAAASNGHTPKT